MSQTENPKLTLVVLAAGMGSRYGGLKQMDPLGPGGETILDYSVYDAKRAGFEKVVFVIREEMREAFEREVGSRFSSTIEVGYAYQRSGDLPEGYSLPEGRTKPWGTAHAVLAARAEVEGGFVVVNADDFYGEDAYRTAAAFLKGDGGEHDYAMVGYTLRKTLSKNGSVARGLCKEDENHLLVTVEELTKIVPDGSGARNEEGDVSRELSGDEPVSMNFWALRPAAMGQFWDELKKFLDRSGNDLKAEYYIPTAIDGLIQSGVASVKVLRTDATWFGVTYQEDRDGVVATLADLVETGQYPSPLWGEESGRGS